MGILKAELLEKFEYGDPAAPLGCEIRIYRDDREVCFIEFPNEQNEDIQEMLEASLRETFGIEIKRTHNADVDYYHHSQSDY